MFGSKSKRKAAKWFKVIWNGPGLSATNTMWMVWSWALQYASNKADPSHPKLSKIKQYSVWKHKRNPFYNEKHREPLLRKIVRR